jgi:hypothetical protein
MAASRSRLRSRTRYTAPIPPAPTRPSRRKRSSASRFSSETAVAGAVGVSVGVF